MEQLEKFLKSKRAFSKFKRNVEAEYKNSTYKEYIGRTKPNARIPSAFSWKDSPEGHKYWSKINKEWTNEN